MFSKLGVVISACFGSEVRSLTDSACILISELSITYSGRLLDVWCAILLHCPNVLSFISVLRDLKQISLECGTMAHKCMEVLPKHFGMCH